MNSQPPLTYKHFKYFSWSGDFWRGAIIMVNEPKSSSWVKDYEMDYINKCLIVATHDGISWVIS